jgi:hypothetical protein
MKLELIKKYEPEGIDALCGCVVRNDGAAILLVDDKEDAFNLLCLTPEEMRLRPLGLSFESDDGCPVLFAVGSGFGVVKNTRELLWFPTFDGEPERVAIDGKKLFGQVLPPSSRLTRFNRSCPISADGVLPVCFEHTTFDGHPRFVAFLELNMDRRKARWQSWMNLNEAQMPSRDGAIAKACGFSPPILDSVMLKGGDVFVFSPGISTNVNKYGMGSYGIFRVTHKGDLVETLLDSGNLFLIDQKKRGVNGVFTASEEYVIMTPVFQSDEWKGRQKLFHLATHEIVEVELPRGFGKYPRIVQHSDDHFIVYLWDTRHFAICRKS